MKAEISKDTQNRVSDILDKPVERNFDKAINQCFDKLENGNSIDVLVCDQTEKMAGDEEKWIDSALEPKGSQKNKTNNMQKT